MAERKGSLAAAEARYVRVSPQKARLVVDMIRGRQAGEAVDDPRRHQQGHYRRGGEGFEIGDRQCRKPFTGSGRGQAVRVGSLCERRAAAEAHPPRAYGPRLPVSAPDLAHRGQGERARRRNGEGITMGQKVHPYGFRLGVTKTWRSRWFAKQDYAKLLHEDLELKESLTERLKAAGVSSIEVDRPGNKLRITIRTSRPGIIIGRKGAEIEKLKGDLGEEDQARSVRRHSGSAPPGAGRAVGFRIDRAAA